MVRKMVFNGIEVSFYEQNIFNNNSVLISFKNVRLKTREVKCYLDIFISAINDLIEVGAIVDEQLEKYSTAFSVLNAMKAVFSRKNFTDITIEMMKTTLDVIKEIALLEINDSFERASVKAAVLAAEKLLDMVADVQA